MQARRQSSTTSLARFVRDEPPDRATRSIDFCNSFWGPGDGGVDVLFARMRGAARAMEELRGFWRERAAIEDDYAKRMAKLSKMTLGRDEIGELRNSLDCLRLETEHQASAHLALAQSMRLELETPATDFIAKQAYHKKTAYANVEKAFRYKQQQESIVAKAREKYKTDCTNINLYTAQSSLVQGKDLDRIHARLDKAKQTVVQNEREYANTVTALQDTWHRWEADWKVFCDHCQDLEDERIEFMKDNMWTYANAVSTVCVSDDESCEKVRVTLELLEPEKDMENFVRDYGTGADIPDAPRFHSYSNSSEHPPRPSARPSQYIRSSSRSVPSRGNSLITAQAPPEPALPSNVAGLGASGRQTNGQSQTSQLPSLQNGYTGTSQTTSTGNYLPTAPTAVVSTPQTLRQQSIPLASIPQPAHGTAGSAAQSYRGSAQASRTENLLHQAEPAYHTPTKIGQNAHGTDVDSRAALSGGTPMPASVGDSEDPIAKALEDLKTGNARKRTTGSMRSKDGRNGTSVGTGPVASLGRKNTLGSVTGASLGRGAIHSNLPSQSTPVSSNSQMVRSPSRKPPPPLMEEEDLRPSTPSRSQLDLHGVADSIVGAHPSSRPSSPAPPSSPGPSAVFMHAPQGALSPSNFVDEYAQSLPGERANRRLSVNNTGASMSAEQNTSRPTSPRPTTPEPFAGIGAHGRSPSPQPGQNISRVTSPNIRPLSNDPQQSHVQHSSANLPSPALDPRQLQRVPSPSIVGITIDARGQVAHDAMADEYARRAAQFQSGPPSRQPPPPHPSNVSPQVSRQHSGMVRQDQQAYQSYAAPQNHQQPSHTGYGHSQQFGSSPSIGNRSRQGSYSEQPGGAAHYRQGSFNATVQGTPPQMPAQSTPGPPAPAQMNIQQPSDSTSNHPYNQIYQRPSQQQSPAPPAQYYSGHPYAQPSPVPQTVYNQPNPAPSTNSYGNVSQMQPQIQQQSISPAVTGYNGAAVVSQSASSASSYGYSQGRPNQQTSMPQQVYNNTGPRQVAQQHTLYAQQQQQQQQPAQTLQQPVQQQQQVARTPSPRPPPTSSHGNNPGTETLEDGTPILFYVRALYDYVATIDEEFDFQSGDIIAVTATPEDGWWSGVLLDDARRIPGRTVFPSNFVCLF